MVGDDEALSRLAYYFEYDYADGRDPSKYVAPSLGEIERWQQLAGSVALRQFDRDDGVTILTDTRPCASASGWASARPWARVWASEWARVSAQALAQG